MKITQKKIIIIGCSGSGKSFFSIELSEKLHIPRYHLDCIYWMKNWVPTDTEVFRDKVKKIMENDEWIIDGNYSKTLEDRLNKAELVFFLDLPTDVCIASEKERRGKKREDLPDYLVEEYDPEFVEFIRGFKDNGRVRILELLEKYKDKQVITFKTREEKNEFLKNIE